MWGDNEGLLGEPDIGDPGVYLENNAGGGIIDGVSNLQSSSNFCTKILVDGMPSHLEKCSSILFFANSYRKLSFGRDGISIIYLIWI